MVTLLVTSDCPSVCGWKAELMCSFTLAKRDNSLQNALVKTVSRSLTMEHGNPWRHTIP